MHSSVAGISKIGNGRHIDCERPVPDLLGITDADGRYFYSCFAPRMGPPVDQQEEGKIGNAAGALPYSVFVDPKGTIAYARAGAVTRTSLDKVLAAMMS